MRFPRRNPDGKLAHQHRSILGLFMYAVTSSMNMNESAVNMHMEFTILY
jgi:hypothetical protein